MKLKFLGTGTSQGVPVIGCQCEICTSNDLKDSRFRSSVIITTDDEKKLLIDCTPDFRQQMLLQNETNVDAILITHEHNDHVIGLDDMRPILFRKETKEIPIFCQKRVAGELKKRFEYAFAENKYPGAPSFELNMIDGNFNIGETLIEPINVLHGKLPILGYKFGNLAYITDASFINTQEKMKLKKLDVLILNCLRKDKPHHSHFVLSEILELYAELKPKKLYLTHISHQFGLHSEEKKSLPAGVFLAYDGLEMNF